MDGKARSQFMTAWSTLSDLQWPSFLAYISPQVVADECDSSVRGLRGSGMVKGEDLRVEEGKEEEEEGCYTNNSFIMEHSRRVARWFSQPDLTEGPEKVIR